MQRIINGKRYNTETAEEIAHDWWGGGNDFRHYDETLYRTPRGNFFLAGSGGPLSRWARSTGQNSWSGGSGIEPMTEEEARTWCEEHNFKASLIAQYFTVEDA